MSRIVVEIPGLRVDLPNTTRDRHWAARKRRTDRQKSLVAMFLGPRRHQMGLPHYRVLLVRVAPGDPDDDNVVAGLKAVRDAVAEFLGVDDGDRLLVSWSYGSERSKTFGLRIEIESRDAKEDEDGTRH